MLHQIYEISLPTMIKSLALFDQIPKSMAWARLCTCNGHRTRPQSYNWAMLASQINPNFTTVLVMMILTQNTFDPLQQTYVTPLTIQYPPSPIFPSYYNTKEPLTSIVIISQEHNQTCISTFCAFLLPNY